MSKKASPKSPVLKDCIWAFLVGGLLCAAGQAIADLMMRTGLEIKDARLLGSMSLIALSIVLTGSMYTITSPSMLGRARWCPLPDLPTPLRLRPSNSNPMSVI